MVFLTKLMRLGTRQEISPVEVVLGHELAHPDLYRDYFGIHDSNAFIRAYSSWSGKTPGQFREAAIRRSMTADPTH